MLSGSEKYIVIENLPVIISQHLFFKIHSIAKEVVVWRGKTKVFVLFEMFEKFLVLHHVSIENIVKFCQRKRLAVFLTEKEKVFAFKVIAIVNCFFFL